MNKNIQFHIMSFCNSLVFFAPVAILLRTTKGVTVSQFFLLQALLSVMIFVFEIPTGMLADKIGYKKAMLLSQIMLFLARFLFLVANHIIYFVIEAVMEAFSCCFLSGTTDAYLYERCKQNGDEEKFVTETAKANAWGTAGFLVSTMGYYVLYSFANLNGLVVATEFATVVSIVAVLFMPEAMRQTDKTSRNPMGSKHTYKMRKLPEILNNFRFSKILWVLVILDTVVGVAGLIINFLYAEKLSWSGLPMTWMTPIILCYSILELLVPKVISSVRKENEANIYQMCSLLSTGLWIGIFLFQNHFVLVFMIGLPFILRIVETIQYKYENEYIDRLGQSHNRATLLSVINMGNNLFSVIFLLFSAIVTTAQGNVIFLFAGILMFAIAVVGIKVIKMIDK